MERIEQAILSWTEKHASQPQDLVELVMQRKTRIVKPRAE